MCKKPGPITTFGYHSISLEFNPNGVASLVLVTMGGLYQVLSGLGSTKESDNLLEYH